MKSVAEKGFPASLNYAVTRGKGEFSFRFSQLVTAASYSEADVSARPNSLNLFYRPLSGTALIKKQKVTFQRKLHYSDTKRATGKVSRNFSLCPLMKTALKLFFCYLAFWTLALGLAPSSPFSRASFRSLTVLRA